jgi:uncharacterized Zn-finger protein
MNIHDNIYIYIILICYMEYRCNKCNKKYSSYQSLWIHNKKYHTIVKTANDCIKTSNDCVKTANTFKYCNKIFTRKNNMNVHITPLEI